MNRDALADLMAEYGMALDEDRLVDWVSCSRKPATTAS